ncbi:hypothetical protein Jiend_59050 [Micromonospora endophytica]|nr:hypothetical protein Jiend_59050 [Micromonospora endophytica]
MGGVGTSGGTTSPGVASASPPTTRCSGTAGGGVGRGDRFTFGATAFGHGTACGVVAAGATGGATAVAAATGGATATRSVVTAALFVAEIARIVRTRGTTARARSDMNTQPNREIGGASATAAGTASN